MGTRRSPDVLTSGPGAMPVEGAAKSNALPLSAHGPEKSGTPVFSAAAPVRTSMHETQIGMTIVLPRLAGALTDVEPVIHLSGPDRANHTQLALFGPRILSTLPRFPPAMKRRFLHR